MHEYIIIIKYYLVKIEQRSAMMKRYALSIAIILCGLAPVYAEDIGSEKDFPLPPQPLSTHAEWNQGFLKCEPQNSQASQSYAPGPGWAILSVSGPDYTVNNNGGGGISLVLGGPTYPGVQTITSQFDLLLGIARAKNNTDALKDIRSVRDAWLKSREKLPQANAVNYWVWANSHGSCQDQKGGSVAANFSARLRFVGTDTDLTNAINNLRSKYFPDI